MDHGRSNAYPASQRTTMEESANHQTIHGGIVGGAMDDMQHHGRMMQIAGKR